MIFGQARIRSLSVLFVTGLILAVTSCKKDVTAESAAIPTGIVSVSGIGSISGTVVFTGKVPPNTTFDTSLDPACSDGDKHTGRSEQFIVNDGKLANVFVYVKSGPLDAMVDGNRNAQPAELDQHNCQFVPHVIGVASTGFVEFRNSDPTMHRVQAHPIIVGNDPLDVPEGPHLNPVMKRFVKPELMIPVHCENHPWMQAFINVSPTPYFAVTDSAGHYEIRGLPPGDYVLGAVHEKMPEQVVKVTVTTNDDVPVDFTFSKK